MLLENDTFKANWIVSDFGNNFHKLTDHNLEILLVYLSNDVGQDLLQSLILPDSFYNLALGVKESLPFTQILTIHSAYRNGVELSKQEVKGLLLRGMSLSNEYIINYHYCFSMSEMEDDTFFYVEATENWVDGCVSLSTLRIQSTKCYKTLHEWKSFISSKKLCDLVAYKQYSPLR